MRMAQTLAPRNNLVPRGKFGSRKRNDEDCGQPRYISSDVSDPAKHIFLQDDTRLLKKHNCFNSEEGQLTEPSFFLPIVPMFLINENTAFGLGTNVKIPAHPAYETMQCTLRWVERVQEENLHCFDTGSAQSVLDSIGMPHPGYDTFCGSIEASVDTNGTERYWCECILKHKEKNGNGNDNVHTFAVEEMSWKIIVDLYEKYLADLCKQPSMRSQGKAVHPRIGTHNRESDVPMLASYDAIHRDGTMFLVHLHCEHVECMQTRAVSDSGRLSSEWASVLKEELLLKQHVPTAATIDLLGTDQCIKSFSSLCEAFAGWLALQLQ